MITKTLVLVSQSTQETLCSSLKIYCMCISTRAETAAKITTIQIEHNKGCTYIHREALITCESGSCSE